MHPYSSHPRGVTVEAGGATALAIQLEGRHVQYREAGQVVFTGVVEYITPDCQAGVRHDGMVEEVLYQRLVVMR